MTLSRGVFSRAYFQEVICMPIMWSIVSNSIGSILGAAFWGGTIGLVLILMYMVLLPHYIRLWNKKYDVPAWLYIMFSFVCVLMVMACAAWSAMNAVERTGEVVARSVTRSLEENSDWIHVAEQRMVGTRGMGYEDQLKLYLDNALIHLQRTNPAIVNLLRPHTAVLLTGDLLQLDMHHQPINRVVSEGIAQLWEGMVQAWTRKIRAMVTLAFVLCNTAFLGVLSWKALKDIRL